MTTQPTADRADSADHNVWMLGRQMQAGRPAGPDRASIFGALVMFGMAENPLKLLDDGRACPTVYRSITLQEATGWEMAVSFIRVVPFLQRVLVWLSTRILACFLLASWP